MYWFIRYSPNDSQGKSNVPWAARFLTSSRAPPVNIDQIVSDFDGVTFHISTPEAKSKILVSIQVKCYDELVAYGAQQVLDREYGQYIVEPENGYNFSVQVDLDNLPADKGKIYFLILQTSKC